MSRHPAKLSHVSSREETIAEHYVNYMANASTPKATTIAEVAKATKRDNAIQCVFKLLARKRHSVVEKLTPEEADRVKSFKLVLDQLSRADTEDGSLLLEGTKLVIPHELTDRVIEIAHLTHPGIVETKSLIREKSGFRVWIDALKTESGSACLAKRAATTHVQNLSKCRRSPPDRGPS